MRTKKVLITGILIIGLNMLPALVHAQIDPGEDPDAPIDGGLTLFVAAGIGYGIKKARDSRKINKTGSE